MGLLTSDVRRVFVYDDNDNNRAESVEGIREIGLEGIAVDNPLSEIVSIIDTLGNDDGLFCDYHLKKCRNYARFDGDQIVSAAYMANKPALLCTSYANFDSSLSRTLRRYIPVVLTSRDLQNLECIISGFEVCINEFKGNFTSERKPWRALVRVVEVDAANEASYIVVPSWQTDLKIPIFWDNFPEELRPLAQREGHRFHAMVNLGSERIQSLYLYEWEAS